MVPPLILFSVRLILPWCRMDDRERNDLIKNLDLKALKEAAKAQGIKPGRCPTKTSIARMLPDEVLRSLGRK
jgi:hypothetical protein